MTVLKILALLLLLSGCARTPILTSRLPVTDQQGLRAADSVSRLREQFNQNDCLSIYREGALNFRFQREKDWLNDCEDLRTNLGAWRTYTIKTTARCGVEGIVCMDGLAAFERTTQSFEVGLLADKGRSKLMWFVIGDQGQMQIFPGPPDERFADPPPFHLRAAG
jgi:hypothetical protein